MGMLRAKAQSCRSAHAARFTAPWPGGAVQARPGIMGSPVAAGPDGEPALICGAHRARRPARSGRPEAMTQARRLPVAAPNT
ncbi:MAG: hypothetical protein RJA69_1959 [Pseudomonadota bacterium]|jgi:hypothetical protein